MIIVVFVLVIAPVVISIVASYLIPDFDDSYNDWGIDNNGN